MKAINPFCIVAVQLEQAGRPERYAAWLARSPPWAWTIERASPRPTATSACTFCWTVPLTMARRCASNLPTSSRKGGRTHGWFQRHLMDPPITPFIHPSTGFIQVDQLNCDVCLASKGHTCMPGCAAHAACCGCLTFIREGPAERVHCDGTAVIGPSPCTGTEHQ